MDLEQNALAKKLTQGKEFTMQLRSLDASASKETQGFLVKKILSTFEEAFSILGMDVNLSGKAISNMTSLDSPCSIVNNIPRSEEFKQDFKVHDISKGVCKKRKRLPCWTERVRVSSSTGLVLEGPLKDGFSWRKYGQKGILGANFPRGYYRCTHRHSQGCLATKLVQRLDEDPALVEVTYKGQHTCTQTSQIAVASELTKLEELKDVHQKLQLEQETSKKDEDIFINFEAGGLKIETENLDNMEDIFPSYSFAPNFKWTDNVNNYNVEFLMEDEINRGISPTFVSPAISEPNCQSSMSPCHMNSFGLSHTHSDLTEIISGPASVANSPSGDLSNLLLDGLDSLPIDDNSDLFSVYFSGMSS